MLYEETILLILQSTQSVHKQFLNELNKVLSDNITSLTVTDVCFRKVEQLGWYCNSW
jgi:citrate lyase gamma subunit